MICAHLRFCTKFKYQTAVCYKMVERNKIILKVKKKIKKKNIVSYFKVTTDNGRSVMYTFVVSLYRYVTTYKSYIYVFLIVFITITLYFIGALKQ